MRVNIVASWKLTALLLALSAHAAYAEEFQPVHFGEFQCYPTRAIEYYLDNRTDMRIGNLSINEKLSAWSKSEAAISITYAVENRGATTLMVSSDFLLLDAGQKPLAAITVWPPKFQVAPQAQAIGNGVTPVDPGTLAAAQSVCLRWHIASYPN